MAKSRGRGILERRLDTRPFDRAGILRRTAERTPACEPPSGTEGLLRGSPVRTDRQAKRGGFSHELDRTGRRHRLDRVYGVTSSSGRTTFSSFERISHAAGRREVYRKNKPKGRLFPLDDLCPASLWSYHQLLRPAGHRHSQADADANFRLDG